MSSKSFFNISDKNIDIKFYFITRTGEPASQNSNDCLHLCFTVSDYDKNAFHYPPGSSFQYTMNFRYTNIHAFSVIKIIHVSN